MKKILIIAFAALCCFTLFADADGAKGFKYLTIYSNADEAAQAGTGSFSSGSAIIFLNNPVTSALDKGSVASINQNYWLFDTNMNTVAYRNSSSKIAYGYAYRYLDYKKFESRDENGTYIGEFAPLDISITANVAYRITPTQYMGVNISGIYEKIDTSSSFGIAFDLGYAYLTPIKDLTLAATIKNLGVSSQMDEENMELPTSMEASIVKAFNQLSTEVKILKINDDNSVKSAIGMNYNITDNFNLRTGYKFGYDAESYTAGFGVNLRNVSLDYAFIPFGEELDDVHMVGLNYRF